MHRRRLYAKEPPNHVLKRFPLEKAFPDEKFWSVHLFEVRIGLGDEVTLTANYHRRLHGAFVRARDEVGRLETPKKLRYPSDLELPQLIERDVRVLVAPRHIPIRLPVSNKIDIHIIPQSVRGR